MSRDDESRRARAPVVLFVVAVALLGLGYGLAAGIWNFPPGPQVRALEHDLRDLAHHWRNDLGMEPTRHLVPGYPDRRERFAVLDPETMDDGFIMVVGTFAGRDTISTLVLYDRDGREAHAWAVDYRQMDPDGPAPQNVFMHGLAVFEDGSIIVNFDVGNTLARVGPCGNVIWSIEGRYHHAVWRSYDDTIWTWRDDTLVQLDPESAEILAEIDLLEDVLKRHQLQGVLALHSAENDNGLIMSFDPFHANHVAVLDPEMADAFPQFQAGDLLISLRELNLVGVIDPETTALKWWSIGPWHRQHHPHFLPDGSILVYNNNMNFGASNIMRTRPDTGETEIVFEPTPEAPFYSWRRGKHQLTPNGNLLITESERGRVFMAAPDGRLVWEYNNIWDEERNGVLSEAMHLPADFFAEGAFRC